VKLNSEILKYTVVQINEMQSALREAAKQIEGSSEYIEKQMKIFRENQSLKNAQKLLEQQREQLANSFFAKNTAENMIDDELKRSQEKGDQ